MALPPFGLALYIVALVFIDIVDGALTGVAVATALVKSANVIPEIGNAGATPSVAKAKRKQNNPLPKTF